MRTSSIQADLKQQPFIDYVTFLINQGMVFSLSDRVDGVGNDESIFTYMENPSSSGVDYDILMFPRAGGEADIDVSFGASQGDTGDAITPRNLQSSSTNTLSGTFEESVSTDTGTLPSHGTNVVQDFLPGGTKGVKVGPASINAITLTIDAGDNKLFEVINRSGGGAKLALNFVIIENDGTYKQTIHE